MSTKISFCMNFILVPLSVPLLLLSLIIDGNFGLSLVLILAVISILLLNRFKKSGEVQNYKKVGILLAVISIVISIIIWICMPILAGCDILIRVNGQDPGFLPRWDYYYEISSSTGFNRLIKRARNSTKAKELPEQYTINEFKCNTYPSTLYLEVVDYDPFISKDNNHSVELNECIYYVWDDANREDNMHYYKFNVNTKEVTKIPLRNIDDLILGEGRLKYGIHTNFYGEICDLALYDYYDGLNDAVMVLINKIDNTNPIDIDELVLPEYKGQYLGNGFLNCIHMVNGRIFFELYNNLYEYDKNNKVMKCITKINENYYIANVIGTKE